MAMKMLVVALVIAIAGCYPPSPIDQGAGSGSDVGGQRVYAFGAPSSSQGGPRYTPGAGIAISPTGVISAIGGGSASITIASEAVGDFDFTTLGTYDWMYTEAWGTSRESNWNGKASGGWLLRSFDYMSTQGASATDSRSWLNHASSSDDINTIGMHNVGDTLGVTKVVNGYNGTGSVNTGFRFRLPMTPTAHTVRWQGTAFNVTTLVTASVSCPGLLSPQTMNFNTLVSSGIDYRAAVTFSGPIGCDLIVTHRVMTIISGGSGNLYVGPIGAS